MARTHLSRLDWQIQTEELRFSWSDRGNVKTCCATSKTGSASCPPGCPFFGAGCYGETNQSGTRIWREISTDTENGLSLSELCAKIRSLKSGKIWRHNEVGDLPGIGDKIDPDMLGRIVSANSGRRGFTYTHKPILTGPESRANRDHIRESNRAGFVINLSADGIDDVPDKVSLGIAPVCVVVPTEAPRTMRIGKVKILTCPAEYKADKNCRDCGWCARPNRDYVVAFHAHGARKRMVSEIVG